MFPTPLLLLALDEPSVLTQLQRTDGWTFVESATQDKVGKVEVYYKSIDGIDCLWGRARTAVSPDTLMRAVKDLPSNTRWSSWSVPESELLSSNGSRFDYYQYLDNPFPVADRYWFARGEVRVGADGSQEMVWRRLEGASAYPQRHARVLQEHNGAIEVTFNVGYWRFAPEGSATVVDYRICTQTGGSIPKDVGEYAARKTLPTNVADLIREGMRLQGL